MLTAIKQTVMIETEGKAEICSPLLKVGICAEIVILLEQPTIDESMEWTDEDIEDVIAYSMSIADERMDIA